MAQNPGTLFDSGSLHFDALTSTLWDPVGRASVRIAKPAPGERVLDACCGAGASALPTAELVGARGQVDAVDVSEQLLEIGRKRAIDLPQLRFHCADVMTWAGAEYDLVQCVLGIFFLPDMLAGARHLAAQLRPGGRLVVTVFRDGAIFPIPQLLVAAAQPERSEPLGGWPPRAVVSTPPLLGDLLRSAGLDHVSVESLPLRLSVDPEFAWSLVLGSALRRILTGFDGDELERTRVRFQQSVDFRSVDLTILVGHGRRQPARDA